MKKEVKREINCLNETAQDKKKSFDREKGRKREKELPAMHLATNSFLDDCQYHWNVVLSLFHYL